MHNAPDSRRWKIMVVDDEPDLLITLVDWLEHREYDVIPVPNGIQALSRITELVDSLDLLIADLSMSVINGVELAQNARMLIPKLKVIYMTGGDPATAVRRYAVSAGDAVLVKPFTFDALEDAIARALTIL